MERELCFSIESKKLYLEQVLVDYMNVPIFFLCHGEEEYYIALCTNMQELCYVVARVSLNDTYDLLHGNIAMRETILRQKEYWEIISGDDNAEDTVVKHFMNELDESVLPEQGAKFSVLTREMELYVQKFDKSFLAEKYFLDEGSQKRIDELLGYEWVDMPWIKHMEQYTELPGGKLYMGKTPDIMFYDTDMKEMILLEGMYINEFSSERDEKSDSFSLNELEVFNIAIAA